MAKQSPIEADADAPLVQTPLRLKEIGRQLREARQQRGEDLYDIADYLRIRPAYLFALEEGALDAMPGRPYALGFLRTYADYLGFDGQDLVNEVKNVDFALPVAPAVPQPTPRGQQQPGSRKVMPGSSSFLPGTPLLLASIALIMLAYGGWYLLQGGVALDKVVRLPGELGQYAVQLFEARRSDTPESGTTPPDAPTADSLPERMEVPIAEPSQPVAATGVAQARIPFDPPIEQFSVDDVLAGAEGTSPALRDGVNVGLLTGEPAQDSRFEPTPPEPAASPSRPRVVLLAVEPSWIQVKSEGRDFVRTRTLEAGERFPLPDRDDLALWTGNAGGLEILLDGQSLGPVGDRGAVMRNVSLAPGDLTERAR